MIEEQLRITYIGGPTALLEIHGLKLLTDPTFDPPGGKYQTGPVTLEKLAGPATSADSLGQIDVVLLSHDQHFDNLDRSGRLLLADANFVVTTPDGAKRLGGPNVFGLATWQAKNITARNGRTLRITSVPARHGPAEHDRGPVCGFILDFVDNPQDAIYVSGDTVWFDGLHEIAARFHVKVALLFMGAAIVRAVGPWHLTMTASEGISAARHFPDAVIFPLHFEGWAHFTQSRSDITAAFSSEGMQDRLILPTPGKSTAIFPKRVS